MFSQYFQGSSEEAVNTLGQNRYRRTPKSEAVPTYTEKLGVRKFNCVEILLTEVTKHINRQEGSTCLKTVLSIYIKQFLCLNKHHSMTYPALNTPLRSILYLNK
jgi:hypothetical protein